MIKSGRELSPWTKAVSGELAGNCIIYKLVNAQERRIELWNWKSSRK